MLSEAFTEAPSGTHVLRKTPATGAFTGFPVPEAAAGAECAGAAGAATGAGEATGAAATVPPIEASTCPFVIWLPAATE